MNSTTTYKAINATTVNSADYDYYQSLTGSLTRYMNSIPASNTWSYIGQGTDANDAVVLHIPSGTIYLAHKTYTMDRWTIAGIL